jgi:hypothetical protein
MARSHLLKALRPARVTGRRHGGRHGHGHSGSGSNTRNGTGTGTHTRTHG